MKRLIKNTILFGVIFAIAGLMFFIQRAELGTGNIELWTSSGDFNNNASTTGDTTTKSNVTVSVGGDVTITSGKGLSNGNGGAWTYRRPITITGSSVGAQTAYQVPFTLDTLALFNAGKMKNDGSDIRITDASGNELYHWFDNATQNVGGICTGCSAYNSTDYASASQGATATGNYRPEQGVDDNETTGNYWYMGCAQNETLYNLGTINLGAIRSQLARIQFLPYNGDSRWYYNYRLDVSTDNSTWSTIVDRTGSGLNYQGWQTIDFAPRDVRYIRVWISGSTVNTGGHIIEFRAYTCATATGCSGDHQEGAYANGIARTDSKIYFKANNTPANGANATFYVYYGNSSATTSGYYSGANTFEFFDDFNDGNLTGWANPQGTFAASGGAAVSTSTAGAWHKLCYSGGTYQNVALEGRYRRTNNGYVGLMLRKNDLAGADGNSWLVYGHSTWAYWNPYEWSSHGSIGNTSDMGRGNQTWYTFGWRVYGGANKNLQFQIDGTTNNFTHNHSFLNGAGYVCVTKHGNNCEFDDLRARKWVYPEPGVSVGSETTSGGPWGLNQGTIGATGTGLRLDPGASPKWSQLRWSANIPNGSGIMVKLKPANNTSTWAGTYVNFTLSSGNNLSDDSPASLNIASLTPSAGLEMQVRMFNTSSAEPTLSDLKVVYDTFGLTAGYLKQYLSDGTTPIAQGAAAGTSVVLKLEGAGMAGLSDSTDLRGEFEVADYDGIFTGSGIDGSILSANTSSVNYTLSHSGNRKWRARLKDAQGRKSAWVDFGAATVDFVPDADGPAVTIESPADGGNFVGNIPPEFEATAIDDANDVAYVKFQYKYAEDSTWIDISTDTTVPYSADWGAISFHRGSSYNLRVITADNILNTTTTSAITVNRLTASYEVSETLSLVDGWQYAGANVWSLAPDSASWIAASQAEKDAILTDDGAYWSTTLATAAGQYDAQMYKYVVATEKPNQTLDITWNGYGEIVEGWNTYLAAWNVATETWDILVDQAIASDTTITTGLELSKYRNSSDGAVYLTAASSKFVMAGPTGVTYSCLSGCCQGCASSSTVSWNKCQYDEQYFEKYEVYLQGVLKQTITDVNTTTSNVLYWTCPSSGGTTWLIKQYWKGFSASSSTYKGSCPLVFTFDGEEHNFVSDILGHGVLGYYIAKVGGKDLYLPVDNDEYLKIDSSQLKEVDGTYRIKINEMLQETTYLDKVELIVVDYPESYEIYPNEALDNDMKKGLSILTSKDEKLPVSAVDNKGRDVLSYLEKIDRRYAPFEHIDITGFAQPHYLILDLGDIDTKNAVLYINGWTEYPGSKEDSKNDVLEAEKRGIRMELPSLEVAVRNGKWRKVTAFMGMPAGLTKTMTYALQDDKGRSIFPTDDHRIRIKSNQRVYYDKIWVSSYKADNYQVKKLQPQKAGLFYYGISKFVSEDGMLPGKFLYAERVEKDYVKQEGYATRYGDVLPLLEEADDKFVIMTSGDEIDLEFSARELPELPEGWKRGFLLYANGYFKAATPGRAYAYTIEPLPFQKMLNIGGGKLYPYEIPLIDLIRFGNYGKKIFGVHLSFKDKLQILAQYFDIYFGKKTAVRYPDDPEHAAYRKEYNTRYIPAYFPDGHADKPAKHRSLYTDYLKVDRAYHPLLLTNPTGGNSWEEGSKHHSISWTFDPSLLTGSNTIKVQYHTDWTTGITSGWQFVSDENNNIMSTATLSDLQTKWKIPVNITNGSDTLENCKVRLTYNTDNTYYSESGSVVKIKPFRIISINSPAAGDSWRITSSRTITWSAVGIQENAPMKLAYSINGGVAGTWRNMDGAFLTPAEGGPTGGTASYTITTNGTNGGSYTWASIPKDFLSSSCRIRVIHDIGVSRWQKDSEAFAITQPIIRVNTPSGGDRLIRGDSYNISWTAEGLTSETWTINLTYLDTQFNEYTEGLYAGTITDASPDNNIYTYSWTWAIDFNHPISDYVKIKVTDAANATIFDDTYNHANTWLRLMLDPMETSSLFLGTQPTSANSWYINSTKELKWNFAQPLMGTGGTAQISYNYGGSGYTPWSIIGTAITWTEGSAEANGTITVANNTWSWGIDPDMPVPSIAKVRLFDNGRADTIWTSGEFNLLTPAMTITAPVGSSEWIAGAEYSITWTSTDGVGGHINTDAGVKNKFTIKCDTEDDLPWTITTSATHNQVELGGSFLWTIDDKVVDASEDSIEQDTAVLTVYDNSRPDTTVAAWTFTIKEPSISVTAPTLNEEWIGGTRHTITWTSTVGLSSSVGLNWSSASSSSYSEITSSATHDTETNTGSYGWTVPDTFPEADGDVAKIKIYDTNRNATVFTRQFKITRPIIYLTSPVMGDEAQAGTMWTIQWTTTDGVGNKVKLEWYHPAPSIGWTAVANGSNVDNLDDGAVNSFAWTVPINITTDYGTNQAYIRIWDNNRLATVFVGPGGAPGDGLGFNVVKPQFGVIPPLANTTWRRGSVRTMSWDTIGSMSNFLKAEYDPTGEFEGSQTDITTQGYYTANDQGSYRHFTWTIPMSVTLSEAGAAKVKISDLLPPEANGISIAFTIAKPAVISVNQPASAASWTLGTVNDIIWSNEGKLNNVRIEYSPLGDFSDSKTLSTNWTYDDSGSLYQDYLGTYTWTIPNDDTYLSGGVGKIRIRSTADPSIVNNSGIFTLAAPSITLDQPNASSKWVVAENRLISWTKGAGTLINGGKIDISYAVHTEDTDPFTWTADWNQLAQIDNSESSWMWTSIPVAVAGDYIAIKIEDRDADGSENANGRTTQSRGYSVVFPIYANVSSISIPGDTAYVNDTWTITWTTTGTIPAAYREIYYYKDGDDATLWTIAAAGSNPASPYEWTVVDDIDGTVNIRVRDSRVPDNANSYEDTSSFKILGPLMLNVPNGAEEWVVDDTTKDITWTYRGTIGNVVLEYSYDSAHQTWTYIEGTDASGIAANYNDGTASSSGSLGNGSFYWTIPDTVSGTVKVRVSAGSGDTAIVDSSDADFKIIGELQLISPVGGEAWKIGSNHNINWTSVHGPSMENIAIQFYDGNSWYDLGRETEDGWDSVSNSGSYSWTVPSSINNLTTAAKLRIKEVDDLSNTVTSGNWTITYPTITFTTPNKDTNPDADTYWVENDTKILQWSVDGSLRGNLALSYAYGPDANDPSAWTGVTWTPIDTVVNTTEEKYWVTPGVTTNAAVKIQDLSWSGNVIGYSTVFGIVEEPYIYVTLEGADDDAAVAGTDWRVGKVKRISWTSDFGVKDNVLAILWDIDADTSEYWTAQGAENLSNSGYFDWTIPQDVLAAGDSARAIYLKVKDTSRPQTPNSPAIPTFNALPPKITISDLTAVLTKGRTETVTWTTDGDVGEDNTGNLRLVYSTDGTTFKHLVSGAAYNASDSDTYTTVATTDGSYTWTVPNSVSSNCLFKAIDDTRPSAASGVSETFRILRGAVTVTQPSGAEFWTVGVNKSITWSYIGDINNIKLEYSTDSSNNTWTVVTGASSLAPGLNGTDWFVATPDVPGVGIFSWTIPDSISDTSSLKITSIDNNVATTGSSAENFYIKGYFTTPNPPVGDASWTLGGSEDITWTTTGTVSNVNLYYTTGDTWTLIDGAESLDNIEIGGLGSTSFTWTIPTDLVPTPSATAKVKVVDVSDATVERESAAFKLIGKFANLTVPAAVNVGGAYDIPWSTTGNISTVRLTYSIDNRSTWRNMDGVLTTAGGYEPTTVSNSDSYTWTIPNTPNTTAECILRVADDADYQNVHVDSNAFKIRGVLLLVSPGGSADESYTVGSATNVTWSTVGSTITPVMLQYRPSSSSGWKNMAGGTTPVATEINTAATPGTYGYLWTIPDDIGPAAEVKIYDPSDTQVTTSSLNTFNIKGAVDLTTPDGGQFWTIGTLHDIEWTFTSGGGSTNYVKIEYKPNDSIGWTPVDSLGELSDVPVEGWAGVVENDGTFTWTIPDAYSTNTKVRVYEKDGLSNIDSSTQFFRIARPTFGNFAATVGAITNTIGTASQAELSFGKTYDVTWSTTGTIEDIKLEYTRSSAFAADKTKTITASLSNAAQTFEDWTPQPANIIAGDDPNLSLLSFEIDSENPINDLDDEEYLTCWLKISENYPPSATPLVMREASTSTSPSFKLYHAPEVIIAQPLSISDDWYMGTSRKLRWKTKGLVTRNNFKFEYYAGTNLGWQEIPGSDRTSIATESYQGREYYTIFWDIPSLIGLASDDITNCKIRITDLDDVNIVGFSETFTLKVPKFTLTVPTGGEVWAYNDLASLAWTFDGIPSGAVELHLSSDSGTSYNVSVSAGELTSPIPWAVLNYPDISTMRMRIRDSGRTASSDTSDADFTIIPKPKIVSVTLTDKNDTETDDFVVNEENMENEKLTISWTYQGLNIGNSGLTIDYFKDTNSDGAYDSSENKYTIATGVARSSTTDIADGDYSGVYAGSYTWTIVPTALASSAGDLKLRVYDPDNIDVANNYYLGYSGSFMIRGGFEFTTPVLSTQWYAGSSENTIQWRNKGTFPKVHLLYTFDDGETWKDIVTHAPVEVSDDKITTAGAAAATELTNTGSYSWSIPDPQIANQAVKLKLSDTQDLNVQSSSAEFHVVYYTVTWEIRDSVQRGHILKATVKATTSGTLVASVEGNSPISIRLPYGSFGFNFSKSAYVETSTTDYLVGPATDLSSDNLTNGVITWKIYITSTAEAQADFKVQSNFAYDEDTDKLTVNSWLEKQGKLVLGDDINWLGNAMIKIYDGESLKAILEDAVPDSNGGYWYVNATATVPRASGGLGLAGGKTYFARCVIYYGGSEKTAYESGNSFEIKVSKTIQLITAEIERQVTGLGGTITDQAALTKLAIQAAQLNIQSQLISSAATTQATVASQSATTQAAVESAAAATQSAISGVRTETSQILTAASTTIPNQIDNMAANIASEISTELKPFVQSGILTRDTSVKQGATVTISYRAPSGLYPTLTVYDPLDRIKLSGVRMAEIGATGVYAYDVQFISGWGLGDFTVVCSEATKGSVDAITISVIKEDIAGLSGTLSAVLGTTSGMSGLQDSTDALAKSFDEIDDALILISENVAGKVEETKESIAELEIVYNQLVEISKMVKGMTAGDETDILDKMYEMTTDRKDDMVYLKNKTEELKAAMNLNTKMIENVAKKPVVQTWFEFR
ncbi:MAG: DUF2341 domain-containing protein [Candidatus Omnitrophota bacterium]